MAPDDLKEPLASLIASAMDAIVAAYEDQRIIVFNSAAEKMFGNRAAEAALPRKAVGRERRMR